MPVKRKVGRPIKIKVNHYAAAVEKKEKKRRKSVDKDNTDNAKSQKNKRNEEARQGNFKVLRCHASLSHREVGGTYLGGWKTDVFRRL